MFDARIRPLIDPPLNRLGQALAARGVTADTITLIGFFIGLVSVCCISAGWFAAAFVAILANRMADGLDGAVARATTKTDRGGFLDISLDFLFYGLVPVGFALHDPSSNALAAVVLIASFYANGSIFLAFAIAAQKRGLTTEAQGKKTFYYLAGIAEGAETIGFFLLLCLMPAWFPVLAFVFAGICFVSATARLFNSAALLSDSDP